MKLDIKWISIGVVGSLFAVSHLGMIGYIASRKTESQLPKIDIPVGDYTSYAISATKDGYKLSYTANDPKTAYAIHGCLVGSEMCIRDSFYYFSGIICES